MAAVDYRGGGRFVNFARIASTPWGILIAIFVAMTFLPYLSNFIFRLIVG